MKKCLIIDGNSILNRAFYGIRLLTNKNGLYTNAIYGMVTIISRHIENIKPDYCAVAFDLKKPTFRHQMYDGYKANRKGMPEELAVQLPYAKECMASMGLSVLSVEGYEADDILGTMSTFMSEQGIETFVLTGDRDSLQLIDDKVSVLLAKTKETVRFDRSVFQAEYGVDPSAFVDVKALMGDSSDNIPGVSGIGEKTALKLISEFESLDNLYEKLEETKLSDSVKKKLLDGKNMAYLSRTLATICRTVPMETNAEQYAYRGPNAKALRDLFVTLEFQALLKRFGLDQLSVAESITAPSVEPQASYIVCDTVDELIGDQICVYATEDELSFFDGVRLCVLPWKIEYAEMVQKCLERSDWRCYDSKNLYKLLASLGAEPSLCGFDCMLAAYVLDSGKGKYTLETLCMQYQTIPVTETTPAVVAVYHLSECLHEKIKAGDFSSLLYDIEIPLAKVLSNMEQIGFKIDSHGIEAYGEALKETADALQMRIYSYAGEEFNISSPKQLGDVLFEKMGLPKSRKNKTGYSTDAESLQKLIAKHPIIEDILDYRQVTKLKSTYADGLVKASDREGRVHSIFNQTGTATGRLSSSEPNLQNIPVRTELGRQFRKFFVPKNEDYVLIDADYSQIELRLLAHVSNDQAMIDAFLSGEDIHTMTASRVFGVPVNQVTSDLRKKAKAVNFGIMYGIGEYSLSEDLNISRVQAKDYIDSYFEKFPQIRQYLDQVQEEGRKNGYVTTFFGRRRYIPELSSSNKNLQHFGERVAMNSPIQGTAADIIKIAMIKVCEELKKRGLDAELILQVHDELLLEAHHSCAEEAKDLLVRCMESAVSLSIPLSVDAHVGKTWYEAK